MPYTVALIALYGTENSGVRSLAASLKRAGFGAELIFFKEWRNNNLDFASPREEQLLLELLARLKPDLVGLSLTSSLFPVAQRLTARLKAAGYPVIWGGIHPTAAPEVCLEHADYICRGEGEEALVDLAACLQAGSSPAAIANIGLRLEGQAQLNPLRALIEPLDKLPYPDFSGAYLIDADRLTPGDPVLKGAEYRVYASRGCPYACSYCYNSILKQMYRGKGRYYRFRSVEHLMGELEQAKARLPGLRRVKIDDDTAFCYGPEWLQEFCAQYPQRVGVPFECLIHPHLLKLETLRALKAAGLSKIQVGIESGSSREVQADFHRLPAEQRLLEFSRANAELGLEVVYDVIIDNPMATPQDQEAQVDFLLALERPFKVYLYSLNFFPGTELTQRLLAEGSLTPGEVEGVNTKSWRQFRVDFSYPRPARDRFYLSLLVLTSKDFVPKAWIRWLKRQQWLQAWPAPLVGFAWLCNAWRMAQVAWDMWRAKELTGFKIRQYGNLGKMISQ